MIALARRITIGTVVITGAVVGVAAVAVWSAARWQSVRLLDRELLEHADRLAGAWGPPTPPADEGWDDAFSGPPPAPFAIERVPPPLRADGGWILIQVCDAVDGRERFRSPSLTASGPVLATALAGAPAGAPVWIRVAGRPMRGVRLPACRVPPDMGGVREGSAPIGYVARDAGPALAELDRLALTLGAAWALASLLAALAAWWLRRSVLGPLERVGAGIRAIDPERPSGRVAADVPREMAETVRLLNGLLDRLAGVLEREKGTIATIAHELRSPIAGLRTALEVAALEPIGGAEVAARCLPTVVAMQGMVVNLLALARLEAGQERVRPEEIDLDALIDACWATVRPAATARRQRLLRVGVAGRVVTSPEHLRILLGNLLDNASTHAPEGSGIGLEVAVAGGRCRLRLANPFYGPAPDPARIFDPFWRGDAARTSPHHCGLGLALARRLSLLLDAGLRAHVEDRVFVAELSLPPAASPG